MIFKKKSSEAIAPIPRKLKLEMLMYRTNKLGATLVYLSLVFMIVAFSTIYGYIDTVDYTVGLDIIANIICLLALFLTAEKCKVYDRNWGIACFPIAAVLLLKGFLVPTILYTSTISNASDVTILDGLRYTINVIFTVLSALSVVGAGVITIIRSKMLEEARRNDLAGGKE